MRVDVEGKLAGPPAWVRICVGLLALTLIAAWPGASAAQTAEQPRVTRVEAELANACVESGRSKRICVCEVRLLRVSVDPHDYRASALLQTAAYRKSLPAARTALSRRGVSEPEVVALDAQRRRIVRDRLEPACARVGESGSTS